MNNTNCLYLLPGLAEPGSAISSVLCSLIWEELAESEGTKALSIVSSTSRGQSGRSHYRVSEPGAGPPTLSRGDLVTYLGNANSGNRDCLEQLFDSFFEL